MLRLDIEHLRKVCACESESESRKPYVSLDYIIYDADERISFGCAEINLHFIEKYVQVFGSSSY